MVGDAMDQSSGLFNDSYQTVPLNLRAVLVGLLVTAAGSGMGGSLLAPSWFPWSGIIGNRMPTATSQETEAGREQLLVK